MHNPNGDSNARSTRLETHFCSPGPFLYAILRVNQLISRLPSVVEAILESRAALGPVPFRDRAVRLP